MHGSPFRVPAELSNTIEPKAELLIAQQAKLKQLSDKRDAPVGEVPDFLSSNLEVEASPKVMPIQQGANNAGNIGSSPAAIGNRPNIPLPVEALGHFGLPSTLPESSRGLSAPVSQNLSGNHSRKMNTESSGSSSSHHKHSKDKKKKKDKKKHKHKDKEKEKKKSKKHDKEKKRKSTPSTTSETKHSSISLQQGEEVGASEASAQGMSSGSSSCGSPTDSPKRTKTDDL